MPSVRTISTALITGAALVAGTGMAVAASEIASRADEQGAPITLSGSVEGLVPGAARDLSVTIANPNPKPLVVGEVTTAVASPDKACPATTLTAAPLAAPVAVPAQSTASGRIPVTLAADAPSACQGVRFALRFSVVGRGEGSLTATPAPVAPATPAAPSTPASGTPATAKPSGALKTVTVTRRRRVCMTLKVRVRGKVRRRKVCRIVKVKVKIQVPR